MLTQMAHLVPEHKDILLYEHLSAPPHYQENVIAIKYLTSFRLVFAMELAIITVKPKP